MTNQQNLLPLLYTIADNYGWSQGMRAINHLLLADQLPPTATILEIGCGNGRFLHELGQRQPHSRRFGVDLNAQALPHAQRRTANAVGLTQSDLAHLPFENHCFDLVAALDVYDQAGVQLGGALAESRRVLRHCGLLLLRLSAYRWLEGAHDRAFNTGQRYQRQEVTRALQAAQFTLVRVTYANTLFAPAVIPLRLLQRWGLLGLTPDLYTDRLANRALATALRWESHWLRTHNLPFGISLYVLARKST